MAEKLTKAQSDGEHYAESASCSDHSPGAGNMVSTCGPRAERDTITPIADVSDRSAAQELVETIAAAIRAQG